MSIAFARRSFLGAIAGSSLTLGSFISGVAVARLLGVEAMGTVGFLVWIALMAAPFVDFGMAPAVARYAAELRGRGEADEARRLSGRLARALIIPVVIALAAVLVIAFAGDTVAQVSDARLPHFVWLLLAALIGLQVFAQFAYSTMRGEQAFGRMASVSAVSLLLQVLCVGAGGWIFGISGALGGYVAGQIVPAVFAFRLMARRGSVAPELVRRVRRFALFAWAAGVASAFVWSRIEIFFLERYWGVEAVGLFTVALALTSLATQAPQLLTGAFLPLLSEQYGRSDIDAMRNACRTGTRLLAALAFPACLGMAAITPALLPLIYGHDFAGAIPATMILAAAAALSVTTVPATHMVMAAERSDFIFFSSIIGAICAVMAGFLLVPAFGLIGAALARAGIQLLMVGIGTWFVWRRLGFEPPVGSLARVFFAATVTAAVAFAAVQVIGGPISLVVALPLAATVYLPALRLFRALPESDRVVLSTVVGGLPHPVAGFGRAIVGVVVSPGRSSTFAPQKGGR